MSITVAAATLLLFTGAADAVPSTDSVALTCDAEKAAVWNAENGASRNEFTKGASDNLRASKVALDIVNVNFFLAEGSLLGWYRNCMPIPWDTDLDLGVMMEDLGEGEKADAKLEEIKAAMAEQGFAFSRPVGSRSEGLTLVFDRKGVRTDIHFFYRNDETNEFYINILDGPTSYKNVYTQFEVRPAEAFGVLVAVPYPAQEYLATTYGDFMRKRTSERGTGEGTAGWNLESPLNANVTRRSLKSCEYRGAKYESGAPNTDGRGAFCVCEAKKCMYAGYAEMFKCMDIIYSKSNGVYACHSTYYTKREVCRDGYKKEGYDNKNDCEEAVKKVMIACRTSAYNKFQTCMQGAYKGMETNMNKCMKDYYACNTAPTSSKAEGGGGLSWTLIAGVVLACAGQLGY